MDYLLRPAVPRDLDSVLKWMDNVDQLRAWGLPGCPFPPDARSVWTEIKAEDNQTVALMDEFQRVVGFGQILLQEPDDLRLTRIIVAPECRELGLGRMLCLRLMEQAARQCPSHFFSLRVSPENTPALYLYRSLGFAECSTQEGDGYLLMKREALTWATRWKSWASPVAVAH